ncbi:EsaB/YukD family protein [Lactovum odontotermitis]
MEEWIDIRIENQEDQLDLRVPRQVTIVHLTQLIRQALEDMGRPIRGKWHLELKDKQIHPKKTEYLSRYPIGDGAAFLVVDDEENK